ncbi:MAG TPA: tRNA (adenosine(37)-N6)-threonylcarbamoyltransferase complex dimerization subunit type 1 TsaB [Myxococcota bacterium]|nr:tRNA (adenosine(37)-N6)-threonylcarbamoyltransferase complex dimerization subunit type 1 TsaB [Myxococcota bacterium]
MLILAIDTATRVTAVALLKNGELLAESAERSRNHSPRLFITIERLLAANRLSPGDLRAVAVGQGPGSFTGIRVGLTLAKTLAYALDIPLLGISTLMALAENGHEEKGPLICPALDALKGEVFSAGFRISCDGLVMSHKEAARDPAAWAAELACLKKPCLILGSAVARYREVFEGALGKLALFPCNESSHEVRAQAIGKLAMARLAQGETDDPRTLEPHYCRLSEAELNAR